MARLGRGHLSNQIWISRAHLHSTMSLMRQSSANNCQYGCKIKKCCNCGLKQSKEMSGDFR